jgi:uncharacterized protein
MKQLLMIFAKNPMLGKVKTRLARDIGEAKALEVYLKLLTHTSIISSAIPQDKRVFYSDFIPELDVYFDKTHFQKRLQVGDTLGNRMKNAFADSFADGYSSVVIIGSDCPELNQDILLSAFELFSNYDVVIGPATDGGYYLLGTRLWLPEIFENKNWSTETVLSDTIQDLNRLNIKYALLPYLSDVDEEKDLTLMARIGYTQ